jgi:pseudouridylate synthase
MNTFIDIHPLVKDALEKGLAVVALESTIISHGLPYPENIKMAKEVEDIIRSEGAVPATIAVIDGRIKIGLEDQDLMTLSTSDQIMKLSRRDIPYAISKKIHGATTVSATMVMADMVGIKVFATGGIGGVHRGAEDTFDISRDLREFETSDVLVVTAGAKAILDLSKTLEVLETNGVEVIGYQTDLFPAFYSRESHINVPMRLDTPEAVAALMTAKWQMGLKGGIVLANPIPKGDEISKLEIDQVIDQAIKNAKKDGISGKETTPYLLKTIVEMTGGKSLKANLALVKNNARLAAQIAKAYVQTQEDGGSSGKGY